MRSHPQAAAATRQLKPICADSPANTPLSVIKRFQLGQRRNIQNFHISPLRLHRSATGADSP